jgi:hypothetical protein
MSQEIINVLNYLGEQLGIVIDWTSENVWPQVMDILGRYRLFELVSVSFWLLVEIAMLIVATIIFKKLLKGYVNIKESDESNLFWNHGYYGIGPSGLSMVLMGIGVIFAVSGMVTFSIDIGNLLKWLIVPEIKYLEMLKGLMT